jgi:hypothetical protein
LQSGSGKNRGRLKNGAPGGDPSKAPRCGARTRARHPCRSPAMKNGRCRMHGGKSTGPRTQQGLERMRRARTKHGHYSAEGKAFTRSIQDLLASSRALLALADAQIARTHADPRNNPMQSGAPPRPSRPAPRPRAATPVDVRPPAGEAIQAGGAQSRWLNPGAPAGTEGEDET